MTTQVGALQTGSSSAKCPDAARCSAASPTPPTAGNLISNPQREAAETTSAVPVVMLLVPMQMQRQSKDVLAKGCWATLYRERNLQGDSLTLVGPVAIHAMSGPFGEVNSIRIDCNQGKQ